jgi:hypothetical protein
MDKKIKPKEVLKQLKYLARRDLAKGQRLEEHPISMAIELIEELTTQLKDTRDQLVKIKTSKEKKVKNRGYCPICSVHLLTSSHEPGCIMDAYEKRYE